MRGLISPSYFVWIIVPLALYGIYASIGLPHVIWSYRFVDNGSPYDPALARYYTSCTFWGPYGLHNVAASNGHCGYVAFFKEGRH